MLNRLPSLEYNLGHPHPNGQLFLLATIAVFLLTLPVLVLVNLVTLGSELVPSLQPQFQPNDTLLAGWWGTHRLPPLLRPKAPKCQPQDLGRGDTFRVSASLFDYTIMSTWNTTEAPSASRVQEQKRVEYRGQSFADCFVNNTRFDFSLAEQTQTVTVGVVCPGTNLNYPIYVSMETKMVFASELTRDFIGQYYGPGLDLLNLTEANPSDYRKLVLGALEVISTDSLAIMLGSHLSEPALSLSVFYTVDPRTDELTYMASTFTYINGTWDLWPPEALLYRDSIENLVHVVNHAINLDLGSSISPNIFRNASVLREVVSPNAPPRGVQGPWVVASNFSSFYYGEVPEGYQTWAQALFDGKPVRLGDPTGLPSESSMVTTYLCPMYQVKGTSSLLASIFVGTATMTLSVWGTWMLVTAFIAKRMMEPRVQCLCNECITKEEARISADANSTDSAPVGIVARLVALERRVNGPGNNETRDEKANPSPDYVGLALPHSTTGSQSDALAIQIDDTKRQSSASGSGGD